MGNAYVSLIQRGAEKLHAVSPAVELQAGDVLWIAGASEAIHPLRNKKGLRPYGPQARRCSAPTQPPAHMSTPATASPRTHPFSPNIPHSPRL